MTHQELEPYKRVMHHHVILKLKNKSTVEGHIQPWSKTKVFITPLDSSTAKCINVAISEIESIQVIQ